MALSDWKSDRLERLRRWILFVLVLGLLGTETELVLLKHYDEPWQFLPLFLIASAISVLAWHTKRHDRSSLRALQVIMLLFLVAGFVGVGLHFRGAAQFQLETDPAMGKWDLIKKVMRIESPPVLAPGVMLQLGLIGLAYAFSDSLVKRSGGNEDEIPDNRQNS
jgi:hypothetical protein